MNDGERFPFLTCLCPTYGRPRLLENAIACFLAQDYPKDRRYLAILDDAGQISDQAGNGWSLHSGSTRFPSLPEKYNAIAMFGAPRHDTDVFVIWEDDDVYLPHHLSAHAAALQGSAVCQRSATLHGDGWHTAHWSKPSRILSTYTGKPEQEGAAGRFFASIAISRELWRQVGGLPLTLRADFDQQFLARLREVGGSPADPLDHSPERIPGYCFRWSSTGAYHGQGKMRSPEDETWWAACALVEPREPVNELHPRFDEETQTIFKLTGDQHAKS